jgi:hypothetical protein
LIPAQAFLLLENFSQFSQFPTLKPELLLMSLEKMGFFNIICTITSLTIKVLHMRLSKVIHVVEHFMTYIDFAYFVTHIDFVHFVIHVDFANFIIIVVGNL